MTGFDVLRLAAARLRACGIVDAARDARLLLAHAMGIEPGRLNLVLGDVVDPAAEVRFEATLAAREKRQPVSQITGHRLFWGWSFLVTPDVLDPRPETEVLVHAALDRGFRRMLDLGTGSGCVLLSCLTDMKAATGLGVDISQAALAVAETNAQKLGLGSRAAFQQADWCEGVEGLFDLIVSNPPYIAAGEMAGLAPEVRDWEPRLALTPGDDGLAAYRRIAAEAPSRLSPGGRLMVEIGPTQATAVGAMFAAQGLDRIEVLTDFDQRDRVVVAVKPA